MSSPIIEKHLLDSCISPSIWKIQCLQHEFADIIAGECNTDIAEFAYPGP